MLLIQEQERIQAEKERQEMRQRLEKSLQEKTGKKEEIQAGKKGTCFQINEIILDGAEIPSTSKQEELVSAYKGSCLSLSEINTLIKIITQWYVEEGYVTTRVYLPQQNIKSGTLRLRVVEGKIEKISMNKDSTSDRVRVWTAFPTSKGEVLSLKDLDKGIGQLKYPQSSEASMTIEPGTDSGQSVVRVSTLDKDPFTLRLGMDNLGQKSTGENRMKIDGSADNLLSLNETFSFMIQNNVDLFRDDYNTRAYMARLTLPFGYWRSNFSFLYSSYLVTTYGSFGVPVETSGETKKFTWDLENEVFKSRTSTLNLTGQLSYYDTNSYIFDATNPASTYDLTALSFGGKGSLYLWNTYWTLDAQYERGVPILGAVEDRNNLALDEPTSDYEKYTATLSAVKTWQIKEHPLKLQSVVNMQTSPDTLYSSENIVIGDRYSVRGFKENILSGRDGFYMQNDLSLGFQFPSLKEWFYDPIKQFEVFVGFDFGQTERLGQTDEIMGWATGIKGFGKKTNWEITYSEPLDSPDYFKKNRVVYLLLSVAIY
ncbi:MAG: ShlB/FhaC/HecB family hemolysin secretion/activation protein [Alphaproteobacteria bacterium]|nr:ShlB/FhaC/HecB family hemolysin secretion/activation protein [Alphaproteobacteria bacterium]